MPHTDDESELAVPTHVAVIMDGNGRWAKGRGLPRIEGHRRGVNAVREVIEGAGELGIQYLTLFSFSSENWRRPAAEVGELMGLLRRYLQSEIAELHSKNVRFRAIGDRRRLDPDITRLIDEAEKMTAENTGLTLIIALSYGGRQDIAEAARKLAQSVALGLVKPEAIDEEFFAGHLETAGIPDPDLLIRTSGERRISNFLLWQCAYSEFVFIDVFWPDFTREHLKDALWDFSRRERRFGATLAKV